MNHIILSILVSKISQGSPRFDQILIFSVYVYFLIYRRKVYLNAQKYFHKLQTILFSRKYICSIYPSQNSSQKRFTNRQKDLRILFIPEKRFLSF